MKRLTVILSSLIFPAVLGFFSCNAGLNDTIGDSTINKSTEKNPPKEVSELTVNTYYKSLVLNWKNPSDVDFNGIKISVKNLDEENGGENPDEEKEEIIPVSLTNRAPGANEVYSIENLVSGSSYRIRVQTFDNNINYSNGTEVVKTTQSENKLEVINPLLSIGTTSCTLSWDYPSEEDEKSVADIKAFSGIRIMVIPANSLSSKGSLNNPIVYKIGENETYKSLPKSIEITGLDNGATYTFKVQTFNGDSIYSSGAEIIDSINYSSNTLNVSDFVVSVGSQTALLSWDNPVGSYKDFYGIRISVKAKDGASLGNLSNPVSFTKGDNESFPDSLPSQYEVNGLDNATKYTFTIQTFTRELLYSGGVSETVMVASSSNTTEVDNYAAIPGDTQVYLSWTNDEEKYAANLITKIFLMLPNGQVELEPTENTYKVTGLQNGQGYSFGIYTVDNSNNRSNGKYLNATPVSNGSGIQSSDLILYKFSKKTYDFGYKTEVTEKSLNFQSTDDIDLSKTEIIKISGTGKYEVLEKGTVERGNIYTVTVKYTPNTANPAWDEADIKIGGLDDAVFRVIGSSFPQPKDIGDNSSVQASDHNLRLWLRADLISSDHVQGEYDPINNKYQKVKLMPDYSGNGYDAICTDTNLYSAPDFRPEYEELNNMPSVFFHKYLRRLDSTNKRDIDNWSQLVSVASSANPMVGSGKGSTTFVVFRMGGYKEGGYNDTTSISGLQSIIAANYGTSFPWFGTNTRYYDFNNGYYGTARVGYAIKGLRTVGTYRWVCDYQNTVGDIVMVDADTDRASSLTTDVQSNMYGIYNIDTVPKPHAVALVYDPSIDNGYYVDSGLSGAYSFPDNVNGVINGSTPYPLNKSWNSNVKLYMNTNYNDNAVSEKLLGYIYSRSDSTMYSITGYDGTTISPLVNNRDSANKLSVTGAYGRPLGDGKGHRYGLDIDYPQNYFVASASSFSSTYKTEEAWFNARKEWIKTIASGVSVYGPGAGKKRPYDYGNSLYSFSQYGEWPYAENNALTFSGYASNPEYYVNWLNNDQMRNNFVTSLCLGADNNTTNYSNCFISEVIMFDYALTEEEVRTVNNYIYYRYGIGEVQ